MIDILKKGKAGEYQIISTLLSDGYDVLVPVVDNGYDLFATGGKLRKAGLESVFIQVKTGYVREKTASGNEEPFDPEIFKDSPLFYNGKKYIQATWHREFPIRKIRLEQYIDAKERARVIFQLFRWEEGQDDKKIYRVTLNGNDLGRLLNDGYFFKTVLDNAPDFEDRAGEAYYTDYACLNIGLYQEDGSKDEENETILVIAKGSNSTYCKNDKKNGNTNELIIKNKKIVQPSYFRNRASGENGKSFCTDLIVINEQNIGNTAFAMTFSDVEEGAETKTPGSYPFGQTVYSNKVSTSSN